MKLLLGAGMTIFTQISILAHSGLEPVVAVLHIGTRRRAVLEQTRIASLIARVMILRTGESLAAEARRPSTLLRLVIGQNIVGDVPLGVLIELTLLLQTSR